MANVNLARPGRLRAWYVDTRHRLILFFICLAGIAALSFPAWGGFYGIFVLRDVFIFSVFALSLDLLWGKTGLLSFGHATFFGLGAYALSILSLHLDPAYGSLIGLLVGILLAGAVALAFGYFLLFGGVRGPVFAIVTLALTLIASHIAVNWSDVTGGDTGLSGIPPLGVTLFGARYELATPLVQYYTAFTILAVTLLSVWGMCRGRYGRVLSAIQDNELRARALGYNTSLHLLAIFTLSAMLAALAGALFAGLQQYAALDFIGLSLSTEVIMWVAVGGRGTLIGAVVGVLIVTLLKQQVSSIDYRLWPIVLGVFFIGAVFFLPRGVMSILGMVQKIPNVFEKRLASLHRRRSVP